MKTESSEGIRYRQLAERCRQHAARVVDTSIRAAYEDIAIQYETLAMNADRASDRDLLR